MKTFSNQPKTYLQVASEWGALIGIACCVAVFSTLFSIQHTILLFIAIAGFVAVPVITWRMFNRLMTLSGGTSPLSALWRTGTLAFTAGGLILFLVVFIVFKWLDPDFIARMFADVIRMYKALGTPEALSKVSTLEEIYSTGLPTSFQMAMQLFVFTILSGTVLSLLLAAIIRRRAANFRITPPPF